MFISVINSQNLVEYKRRKAWQALYLMAYAVCCRFLIVDGFEYAGSDMHCCNLIDKNLMLHGTYLSDQEAGFIIHLNHAMWSGIPLSKNLKF